MQNAMNRNTFYAKCLEKKTQKDEAKAKKSLFHLFQRFFSTRLLSALNSLCLPNFLLPYMILDLPIFAYSSNYHCPQVLSWQPFIINVVQTGKVKKLAYLA